MFDVNMHLDNVSFESVDESNINSTLNWLIDNNIEGNDIVNDKNKIGEFILQYYLSECELMIRVRRKSSIVGFISGNLEFKNPNELWIKYFCFDREKVKVEDEGRLMEEFVLLFTQKYDIKKVIIRLTLEDMHVIEYLKNKNYILCNYSGFNTGNYIKFKYLFKEFEWKV